MNEHDTAERNTGQGLPDPETLLPNIDFAAIDVGLIEIHRRAACFDDMLEALRGVMSFLEPIRFDRPSDDARAIELDRIMRAAIAKATGGAA